MPNLYIIAGCNGAGKTTASFTVLPEMLQCKEFINADEIARGLSPFQPETVAIAAARIMLIRIDAMIQNGLDFAIETTLTTRYYAEIIKLAKAKGYYVTMVFFWLNSVDLAIERVKARVNEGGHSIPESIIRRRYKNGIVNFENLFRPIVDYWLLIENTNKESTFIAEGYFSEEPIISNIHIWKIIQKQINETSN